MNESLAFENWALGQPNNFDNDQNFVSISYPNFKWGDWSGDTIGQVICQQEIEGNNECFCQNSFILKETEKYNPVALLCLNNLTITLR